MLVAVKQKREKARGTFSDSTHVTLNSTRQRQVSTGVSWIHMGSLPLEEEACFAAAHDPGHPFIVRSQDAKSAFLLFFRDG